MTGVRKKPGVAFWITVALAVGLAYPLSFGPASWLSKHGLIRDYDVWRAYRPIVVAMWDGPDWMFNAIDGYAQLWAGWTATFALRSIEFLNRR